MTLINLGLLWNFINDNPKTINHKVVFILINLGLKDLRNGKENIAISKSFAVVEIDKKIIKIKILKIFILMFLAFK